MTCSHWCLRITCHVMYDTKSMFGSGCFLNNFCAEMYVNNIFFIFKNYFQHQHIKTIQNIQTILNFNKKNLNFLKIKFFRNAVYTAFPNKFIVN